MAAPNPWDNDPIVSAATSGTTPIIQTPGSTKTQTETGILTDTKPAVERKATADAVTAEANAKSAQYKATQDDLATAKQQLNDWGGAEQVDQLVNAVERAKKLVGDTTTGGVGSIMKHVPGTDAYDLNQIITQEVRGNVFLQRLQAMKEENNSPNGGTGIGRIMQAEIPMITGSSGTLDPGMKGSELTQSLDQIERGALRMKAKIAGENPDDPAVIKKYNIPALPSFGVTTPPSPSSPTSPTDNSTPPGMTQLNDGQKQAYHAFLAANPNPSGDQIGTFLTKLTGKQVTNGEDIAKALAHGQGVSTSVESSVGQFLDNAKNDVAGIAQGAAAIPDAAATAAGKVLSVVPTVAGYGADALGFHGAGDYLHGVAHDLANPPQIGNAVESVAPTPNTTFGKVNRFVGQLVGGAVAMPTSAVENAVSRFVGEAPKRLPITEAYAGSSPASTAQALQTEGIPAARPIADPAKRGDMAFLETTRGGHGPVRQSLDLTRRSIADKVAGLAGDGEALTPGGMGEQIQGAGTRTIASMKKGATGLYDQAAAAAGDAPVAPKEALATLDSNIADLSRNPNTNKGVISYLQTVRGDLTNGTKTVADIRNLKTNISGEINRRNLGQTNAERIMGDVMQSARQDVTNSLQGSNPEALRLYNQADEQWSNMSNERDQILSKLVGPDASNPISGEQAMSRVRSMMGNKGDLGRFNRVVNMMNPDEQANFRSTLFNGIGQRSPEEPFSPAYFLAQTRDIQPKALETLFGPDGARSVQNLRIASKGFADASASLNNSRSGFVANFKDAVSALLNLKSAGGGLLGFGIGGVPGAVVGAVAGDALKFGANRLSAKTLMNPDVSQWVRKVASVKTDAGARALLGKLNGLGAGNAALQSELSPFRAMLSSGLNDNAPRTGAAAASPNGGPNQQQ